MYSWMNIDICRERTWSRAILNVLTFCFFAWALFFSVSKKHENKKAKAPDQKTHSDALKQLLC